jgi:hypothetical protein
MGTFYQGLCADGKYILDYGSCAKAGEGSAGADLVPLDYSGLEKWMRGGRLDKVILFRSRRWFLGRAPWTIETFKNTL